MTIILYKFGKLLARHSVIVFVLFVIGVASLIYWAKDSQSTLQNSLNLPGTQSQAAQDILNENFPQIAGTSSTVVFQTSDGDITESNKRAYVGQVLSSLNNLDNVAAVSNPYQETNGQTPNISSDGTTAISTINLQNGLEVTTEVTDQLTDTVNQFASEGQSINTVAVAGGNAFFVTANSGTNDITSEIIGVAAAIVILLIAFGSIVAMGLPLVNAFIGLALGISIVHIIASWVQISSIGPTIATMLGLGVGIDYALFITNRYRENTQSGYKNEEAVGRALATAGQAVIVAGLTVIISLMGLVLIDIPILSSIAYAGAVSVAVAIMVSITILPAFLSLTSRWIERYNIHHLFGRSGFKTEIAKGWGKTITRHSLPISAFALFILAILIIPIFSIELGPPGEDTIPPDNPQRTVYSIIENEFGPGFNGPLLLVEQIPSEQPVAQTQEYLQKISTAVLQSDDVLSISPPTFNQDKTIAVQAVIPKSAPDSVDTINLVNSLQENILPNATSDTGIQIYVGGFTATFVDMSEKIADRMPIFIVSVVLMAFILLVLVFRSIFVPLIAALVLLLSASATFGVLVAVFQWGWGGELIGLDSTGPLVSYVPIMVFAILFGLTMDYEIFLVSRIKESFLENSDNKKSIVGGISKSSRIIIAAALIMFAVFSSFNSQVNVVVKMFGTGLAAAIIIDVFLSRMILVPAIMKMGNKLTWWFPKWLEWLPNLHFEESSVIDSYNKQTRSK